MQRLAGTLSVAERERAERFYFERDKKRSVVNQGVLRIILGRYLDVEPADLQFCYGSHGKPTLAEPFDGEDLRFNSSHSDELLLYAFTRGREIGIDVERVRPLPDYEQIAERFFSSEENAALRTFPSSQKLRAFFDCWTRKEAFLKATGEGLSRSLDQFCVSLDLEEPARLLYVVGEPEEAARWSLQALMPAPDYAAALFVEGQGWHLSCWQWTDPG